MFEEIAKSDKRLKDFPKPHFDSERFKGHKSLASTVEARIGTLKSIEEKLKANLAVTKAKQSMQTLKNEKSEQQSQKSQNLGKRASARLSNQLTQQPPQQPEKAQKSQKLGDKPFNDTAGVQGELERDTNGKVIFQIPEHPLELAWNGLYQRKRETKAAEKAYKELRTQYPWVDAPDAPESDCDNN